MSNEIKVGDTVRVSKDAPRYIVGSANDIDSRAVVFSVDADIATIGFRTEERQRYDAYKIPTKYLIKVGAEAKEPKFKKGDRIKFKNIYELQKVKDKSFRWMLVMFASKEATITAVEDNGFYRVDIDPSIGGFNDDMIECRIEPTEQTEAEAFNKPRYIPKIMFNTEYWVKYEADLAAKIAVAYAEKGRFEPQEIGEKAAIAAKSVVENLKKK